MKASHYIILFICLVLASCQTDSQKGIDTFKETQEITDFEVVFTDKSEPVGSIVELKKWKNVLIAAHYGDEYRFSFIDANSGKVLRRWGKIGEAPGEFIDFGMNFSVCDSSLVFPTTMKKEINTVSIPALLRGDEISVKRESYPYTADFRPLKILPLGEEKVATGFFKSGLFGIVDSSNAVKGTYSDYPFPTELDNIYKGTVFQSLIETNEKKKRFVISILASDIFEIYQEETDGISRIYTSPFMHEPQIKQSNGRYGIDDNESIAGILNIATSDNAIYLGYSPLKYIEASRQDYTFDEVLCFDWDGNPRKKYILPFPASTLCADGDALYGVCNKGDEMLICRFRL